MYSFVNLGYCFEREKPPRFIRKFVATYLFFLKFQVLLSEKTITMACLEAYRTCWILLEIEDIVTKEEIYMAYMEIQSNLLFFWKIRIFFSKKKVIVAFMSSDAFFWKSRVLLPESKTTMVYMEVCWYERSLLVVQCIASRELDL